MNRQAINKLKRDYLMRERFNKLYKEDRKRIDDVYVTLEDEFCIDKEQIQRRINELDEKIEAAKKLQIELDFLPHA